ncbi:hypothetical protein J4G33_04350 [Actinotalea sp. BY-33]|uniref:DoxX family membrane protein n=1 Tax=Actinotalea soli TaxID=2819234 RepID=A0A939RUW1_9CELL|nr:hypothetical protein [Actinotalea soli]MBO1751028.1 hypothetical protein [Actinotalea soli]
MTLLIPLVIATLGTRAGAHLAVRRGARRAQAWDSWPGACGAGLAAVLGSAAVTHFIEPHRSGLIAIVPAWVPHPGDVVTATGVLELCLAVGLVVPRTRRFAAVAAILLLVALFPANVVAAQGVDHPAAPDTPLLPRTLLQVLLVGVGAAAASRADLPPR